MAEIKREPMRIAFFEDGAEQPTSLFVGFDPDHSLADIARWICINPVDARELVYEIEEILIDED